MQAGNYKSRAGVAMIPPTAKDEYWGTTVKNEKGEIINAVIFNPTAQALPETDCIVNSISITPRSDNWHNISDFAVFGLASKIATRQETFGNESASLRQYKNQYNNLQNGQYL